MAGPRTSPNPKATTRSDWDEEAERRVPPEDGPPVDGTTPKPVEPLPAWARFPRSGRNGQGRAFGPDTPLTEDERWEETEQVLSQLDGLCEEVRPPGAPRPIRRAPLPRVEAPPPRPTSPPAARRAPTARAREPAPTDASPPDLWESPPSYLEERLRVANVAATELRRDVRSMAETWSRVVETVGSLEAEVQQANSEMSFIRSSAQGWSPPSPILPAVPTDVARIAPRSIGAMAEPIRPARALQGRVATAPGAHTAYTGFTAERYNRTINNLKARRKRLAGWTFLVAGLISTVLVGVVALAREPMPPLWLAVLPVVWMIPVPFFILSFFGTQRVLRHNHLEVPGSPP